MQWHRQYLFFYSWPQDTNSILFAGSFVFAISIAAGAKPYLPSFGPYSPCRRAAPYLYVCDFKNHRVQIFDSSGRFVRGFGRHGKAPGELQNPSGIAVDQFGYLYVADYGNHRVQIFHGTGAHKGGFGGF
jgi:hypothetical protein